MRIGQGRPTFRLRARAFAGLLGLLLVLLLITVSASANDSTATLSAGGLVLKKTADIAILSEILRVGPKKITVDYEMQLQGSSALEVDIAFPLPRLNAAQLVNEPISTDTSHPENFVNFKLQVDGITVKTNQEIKAFEIEGLRADVTENLRAADMLLPPVAESFYAKLSKLKPETHSELVKKKLLLIEHFSEQEPTYTPLWETQISYYWKQRFEPGKIVRIHHEYVPVTGESFFGKFSFADNRKDWCLDKGTEGAINKLLLSRQREQETELDSVLLKRQQVDYILTTGANWAGPIRSFKLILEKERPEQIISLCLTGLKKLSPTEFVWEAKDFVPKKELSVVFIGSHS